MLVTCYVTCYPCDVLRTEASTGWYTPTKAITRFLDAWRRGDAEAPLTVERLVAVDTPPSVAPRALRTLEGLGLIADGQPTDDLLRFRSAATDADAQSVLADVVRREYADIFTEIGEVESASEDELLSAFANYEPASQRDRMVGLFLGLCQFSGLVSAPRRTGRRPRSASASAIGSRSGTEPQRQRRVPTETRTVRLSSGPTLTLQVSGGVLGLPPDDLEFVFDLLRRIDAYETRSAGER